MRLITTLDVGDDKSEFEIYIRKNDNYSLSFLFSKKDLSIQLIERNGPVEKILKKEEIGTNIFGKTTSITVIAKGNRITCLLPGSMKLFDYKNKKLKITQGKFGFVFSNLKGVLHNLTVNSIDVELVKSLKELIEQLGLE